VNVHKNKERNENKKQNLLDMIMYGIKFASTCGICAGKSVREKTNK